MNENTSYTIEHLTTPQIMKIEDISVTILDDTPEIAIVRVGHSKYGNLGLYHILHAIEDGGVEKVIYDISKVQSDCFNNWLYEFHDYISELFHMKIKYIGVNTNALAECSDDTQEDLIVIDVVKDLDTAILEYRHNYVKSQQI